MKTDSVARVLGHAMIDAKFAEALHSDPATAARSIGVHLGTNEISAMKEINLHQMGTVGNTIRDKFGISALLDQQQQQARMD